MAMVYADLLMRVLYRVRPYEKIPGAANLLLSKWMEVCKEDIPGPTTGVSEEYIPYRGGIRPVGNLQCG